MKTLFIDIETYSSEDLTKSGVYRYVEAPDFGILLFGYAYDQEEVKVIDLATKKTRLPNQIVADLTNPDVLKVAQNAVFEFVCLQKYLDSKLDIRQWRDIMIMAYYLSLPGSLDAYGKILNLKTQKKSTGKSLINYFSIPCTPTRANQMRTRNLPAHDPEKWALFIEYNAQDVAAEREAYNVLLSYNPPCQVWEEWFLDIIINSHGVAMDRELIKAALCLATERRERLMAEAKELTGLDNPNSPMQLKAWLTEVTGEEVRSIAKTVVLDFDHPEALRMLEIRSELSKSSIAKYAAMDACICADNRARGLMQFYGTRTGRWAGRLIQAQNLPRNNMSGLDIARAAVVQLNDYELLTMLYDNPMDVLSQLIRTAFIPARDKFIIADYSAIEARILSWLANEKWQIEVFNTTGLIYEAAAAQMFKIPIDAVTKDQRQRGKIATLALGYQGSVNALKKLGSIEAGIDEGELSEIVRRWRATNPNIVQLWRDVESYAKQAITEAGVTIRLPQNSDIYFMFKSGLLSIRLPSGRDIYYLNARISDTGSIKYAGYASSEDGPRAWGYIDTYGGKITENIVQAIARDCLSLAITRLQEYKIVIHVHDEIIIDATNDQQLDDVIEIMSLPIPWAAGLKLTASGFESSYYMKD